MKLKSYLLIAFSILLIGCTPPQRRPQPHEDMNTNQSAIFHTAAVEYCKIVSDRADVKSGIGHDFDTIATLNRDDVVRVLSQIQDWYIVQLDNNQIGGIDASNARPIVKEPVPQGNGEGGRLQEGEEQPIQQPIEAQDTAPPADNIDSPPPEGLQQQAAPRQQEGQQNAIRGLSSEEEHMVNLVNGERERNGLPPLIIDLEVTRVARIKSQDMEDNNYFSHNSPTYGSPFDMLTSFGINYLHAGENIAGNNSVDNAHTALMNSAGHRRNILNPDFTHIGIGIRPSNRYGMLFTQMFISKPR